MFRLRSLVSMLLAFWFAVPLLAQEAPRVDALGDPLPQGAILRLGTRRFAPIGWHYHAALGADGKRLIISTDHDTQIWDIDTGKLVHSWSEPKPGTDAGAGYLTISPDGQWLATHIHRTADTMLCLIDARTGKTKHQLYKRQGGPVAFSPDSKTLASGPFGAGNEVTLYDVASGKVKQSLGPSAFTIHLTFSSDGRYVVAGIMKEDPLVSYVCVWESATGKQLFCLRPAVGLAHDHGAVFLPDNRHLLVSSNNLALYDIATGKLVRVVQPHGIGALSVDRQGKRMLATQTGKGEIWDLEKLQVIHRLPCCNWRGAMSADGTRAITMRPLRVWDVATGKAIVTRPGDGLISFHAIFSPDDSQILTSSLEEERIHVWDATTEPSKRGRVTETRAINSQLIFWRREPMRFSDDRTRLIVGGELWDWRGNKRVPRYDERARPKNGEPDYYNAIAPNARVAFDWSADKLQFWEPTTGRLLRTLKTLPCQCRLWGHAFSGDSKILAATGEYLGVDQRVVADLFLIDVDSGKISPALRHGRGDPGVPRFSQDGQWLAVNRQDATGIEIWHVPTRRFHRELLDASLVKHPVFALAEHGQLLATGDKDHAIVLFEVTSGQRISRWPGHDGAVTSLSFSHDGHRLVSASQDRTALVWALESFALARLDADDRLWRELASDAARAYPILWALVKAPKRGVTLAHDRLQPDDTKQADALIVELGSAVFTRRQAAMERLRKLGPIALPSIEAALAKPQDLEHRRRLEELARTIPVQPPPADLLRDLRVIQMLEMIGTPQASEVLERIAQSPSPGPRAVAARGALARLRKRAVG